VEPLCRAYFFNGDFGGKKKIKNQKEKIKIAELLRGDYF
jgi:hypothetical protein